jgi:hypothetical protein
MDQDGLVEGRECGECTACCGVLAIVDDGLHKPPGVVCEHCTAGRGCAIYETRPKVCRGFHCGWFMLADLGDGWRPDRSGILISFEGAVGRDKRNSAVNLIVTGGEAVAKSDYFAGLAASFVDGGSKTYLVLPSAPGLVPYNIILNPLLAAAVAAQDLAQVKLVVAECYELLKVQPPIPVSQEQLGLIVSLVEPSADQR